MVTINQEGSGDETSRNMTSSARTINSSNNENTLLSGQQTYFADEKVLIPEVEKVRMHLYSKK